jgi:hypothetical protein
VDPLQQEAQSGIKVRDRGFPCRSVNDRADVRTNPRGDTPGAVLALLRDGKQAPLNISDRHRPGDDRAGLLDGLAIGQDDLERELADDAREHGWEQEADRHQPVAGRIRSLLSDLGEPCAPPESPD